MGAVKLLVAAVAVLAAPAVARRKKLYPLFPEVLLLLADTRAYTAPGSVEFLNMRPICDPVSAGTLFT
jgi:hypothetical protein